MKKDVCTLCGAIEPAKELTLLALYVRGKDGVRVCQFCLDQLSDTAQAMFHFAKKVEGQNHAYHFAN